MRLGTANIRNFPDMAEHLVREDGAKMGGVCQIWGGQEISPQDNDKRMIMQGLGHSWGVTHPRTHTPIFHKKGYVDVLDTRQTRIPLKPENLPAVATPRIFTGTVYRLHARPQIEFAVINCHFIAGGKNGQPGQDPNGFREAQWEREFHHLQLFVHDFLDDDITTFVLGDFNHPRPPKPIPNFRWLVGPRLDRIGVSSRGDTDVFEFEDGIVDLNSDHDGQWTRVRLAV